MVITSWSCWLKTQQARLNTLVNIEPAETLFDGQFSTSANIDGLYGLASVVIDNAQVVPS